MKVKNLSRYVIRVRNQAELNIAIKFYLRASRRPLNFSSIRTIAYHSTLYVGMYSDRTVLASPTKFSYEQVVPFNDMISLADTASRRQALKWVMKGWKPARSVEKSPKTTVKSRPLVRFNYPSRPGHPSFPSRLVRNVRLIKADAKYYVGLEILSDNKFKFKKFLKSKATNVEVLSF